MHANRNGVGMRLARLFVIVLALKSSREFTFFLGFGMALVLLSSLTVTCRTCNPEVTQGRRFDSAPGHCRVTTSGKLFTHMCLCHQAVEFGTGFTAGM